MRISASDLSVSLQTATEELSPTRLPSTRDVPPSFGEVLRGLGREIQSGEATMRTAIGSMRAGGDLSPGELLTLQAGVYRYSEAIDLASRLVDRATGGVKTIVQGGGQ